mmetsp:Transcript_994/g.1934  ORF Transcript_994/g.1934 Transcript_994/m.1934 type:complete len:221 (+) Transcript_994:899-1561(+)
MRRNKVRSLWHASCPCCIDPNFPPTLRRSSNCSTPSIPMGASSHSNPICIASFKHVAWARTRMRAAPVSAWMDSLVAMRSLVATFSVVLKLRHRTQSFVILCPYDLREPRRSRPIRRRIERAKTILGSSAGLPCAIDIRRGTRRGTIIVAMSFCDAAKAWALASIVDKQEAQAREVSILPSISAFFSNFNTACVHVDAQVFMSMPLNAPAWASMSASPAR